MKESRSGKWSFVGAGMGIALFAVFGLLPGAFLGGVMGLNMAGVFFGTPVEPTVLPRVLIVVGMLTGVMVAGLIFVASGASLGWLAGLVIDAMTGTLKRPEAEKAEKPLE